MLITELGLSYIGCSTSTGGTLIFECTVIGSGVTVWQGSAFDCQESNDEISLRHSEFTSSEYRACNNGTIVGQGIKVEGNSYTSQLTVSTKSYKGIIECIYDNGTQGMYLA